MKLIDVMILIREINLRRALLPLVRIDIGAQRSVGIERQPSLGVEGKALEVVCLSAKEYISLAFAQNQNILILRHITHND